MKNERTTVHIAMPTSEERDLLRLLTPKEKLEAMVEAAKQKAMRLGEVVPPPGLEPGRTV